MGTIIASLSLFNTCSTIQYICESALYQEQAVFGKMKMDPAKRAQTQNAGEV